MDKTYAPVTTAQELTEALAKCRAAQEKFATYTQEQVDKIFLAAATAANQMRIPLAKQAVAETGMGVVEDKVIKNHYAAEYIYNAYKDSKTCGVIEEDTAYGIQRIAEPIGVIAAVIPTTNPTSTAIFKTLISLKTRNGIIISPHPRAKGCTIAAARVVLEAAVAAGAPEGIIDRLEKGIMAAGPVTNLLLEIMAGDSSPLYKDLFDRGLISGEFSTEYFHGHGYEAIIFDGESTDPRQVAAAIQAEVERLRREGIPEDLYQAALRKSYGREVMSYNDIDSVANGMIDAHFNGFSIFDVTNRYKAITKEKIEARLQQVMNPQYSALSVVKAEEEQHG